MKTEQIPALLFIAGLLLCGSSIAFWIMPTLAAPDTIEGVVVNEANQTVEGAVVRIQTTEYNTLTRVDGAFTLAVPGEGPFNLTACAAWYFCGGPVVAQGGDTDIVLVLVAHSMGDNPEYQWLPSTVQSGYGENQGCAECHSAVGTDLDFTLPVDEWLLDAHSQAAVNPRFLTMYSGTDVNGNQSPLTRFVYPKDYGQFPLPPDPSQPYYGPGYRLDFPETAGNCAACHTPMAAIDAAYSVDPTQVAGVEAEGIGCDFCHKVWDVQLNTATGLPYANMPGVLSIEFRRPPEGHQFFAGPFDDVAPGEDTYSPLQAQSQFCASCHYGVFWDTVIYNSFGEWLGSTYSEAGTGQTCQDCHMPPLGTPHFALPEKGGLARDPQTIFSHRMPGALDEALLQNTVELHLETERNGDTLRVHVILTNTGAGHHVPTDSPLRQMLLIVTATNDQGNTLTLTEGSVLPAWTGDLAGMPGTYYAKILQEIWTEVTPSGAYWMPTRIIEDTRLPALASDSADFTFSTTDEETITVEARVIFRRAFYDLMQQKGWDVPDILMEEAQVTLP